MSNIVRHDNNEDIVSTLSFKPRARLLLQLGDQLIKNESIALTELVKNSYDADAKTVTIHMENIESETDGMIVIEDDGFGMNSDIVENVWLEPGSDFKSKYINQNQKTPIFGRLPIGEKGIGRFGAHKLGNRIELTTRSKNEKEVFVRIDWNDFNKYKYLNEVPIRVITRAQPKHFINNSTGTKIVISDLRQRWERGIAREVKRSINTLSSPFENKSAFHTEFDILDKPGWFQDLVQWEDIRENALFKFKIKFSSQKITFFKYSFIPWNNMTKLFPKEIDINDKLLETEVILKDNDNSKILNLSDHKIGEVEFEGYIFDLDPFVLKFGLADKVGFRKYLKSNGGVKVFRDGLRVYDYGEPENDWLGLDYRRFQNPSKAISNNLIIASVSLKRTDSLDLIEKTNREGFVENEAYKDFRKAILHCLDIVETLRQTDKKKLREVYGPTAKSAPLSSTISEARLFIEEKIKDSETKSKILHFFYKIEVDYKRVSENLIKAAGAGLSMSVVVHEVEKILFEVVKVLKAEKASERAVGLVQHLSKLIDGYAEIIRKSDKTKIPLSKIISQALFNTEYRLDAHKIKVTKAFTNFESNDSVQISKNLVLGTLINLIDNSIYWLDQKALSYKADNKDFDKKIYFGLQKEKDILSIVMADNGSGFSIPTDDITEPFISAKPGGMGLGLHIASEIMESHRGSIEFPEYSDVSIPIEFEQGAIVKLNFAL